MAYNTAYISQVTLPDGITYDIKDAWAREKLSGLTGAMHFVGVSTTDPTLEAGPTVDGVTSFLEKVSVLALLILRILLRKNCLV